MSPERTALWPIASFFGPSRPGKAWMNISMHGDAKETAEAKRTIEAERLLEEGEAKCFVVMGLPRRWCRSEMPRCKR